MLFLCCHWLEHNTTIIVKASHNSRHKETPDQFQMPEKACLFILADCREETLVALTASTCLDRPLAGSGVQIVNTEGCTIIAVPWESRCRAPHATVAAW